MAAVAKDLVERRVPQFIVLYLGVSWGFVEFTALMVETFVMSPHWTRLAIATVPLLFPSVLLFAYNHGKSGKDQWVKSEKIGIPVNLVVAALVLFMLFGGSDLGAATEIVTVENEDGETVERVVAKAEFRKRTALFVFDQEGGSEDGAAWLPYFIPNAVITDLSADDFFDAVVPSLFSPRLQAAGFQDLTGVPLALKREVADEFHADRMLSGSVSTSDAGYVITTQLHEVQRARVVYEGEYAGPDLLELVDQISVDLKDVLEIPDREEIEDLPVEERLSSDKGALEAYGHGLRALMVDSDWAALVDHMTTATELDPTFADAQHALAQALMFSNRPAEAVAPLQAAMDNLYRIPERSQFVVKSDYYFLAQDTEKAWAVVEMWAELYPNDLTALGSLVVVQKIKNDKAGAIATMERMYELNAGLADVLKEIAALHQENGDFEQARDALVRYATRFPEDYTGLTALATLSRAMGAHDEARGYLDRAILMEPGRTDLMRSLASLDTDVGRFDEAKAGLDRALQVARTPQDRAEAWAGFQDYHAFRGEMNAALEAMDRWLQEASQFQAPYMLAMSQFGDIGLYFEGGRGDEGVALFETLRGQLQPPMDLFIPLGDLKVAMALAEVDRAEAALQTFEANVLQAQMETMRGTLVRSWGDLAELKEDWPGALEAYRAALQLDPSGQSIHRQIARALRHLGQLDEAEEEVGETLRLSPSDPEAHVELAHILEAKGDTAGAIASLQTALEAWANADPVFEPAAEAREMLAALGG